MKALPSNNHEQKVVYKSLLLLYKEFNFLAKKIIGRG